MAEVTTTPEQQLKYHIDQMSACELAVARSQHSFVEHAYEAGLILVERKEALDHGDWEDWLEENWTRTGKTASEYMRLARHFKREEIRELPSIRQAIERIAESNPKRASDSDQPTVADSTEPKGGATSPEVANPSESAGGDYTERSEATNTVFCLKCETEFQSISDTPKCPKCDSTENPERNKDYKSPNPCPGTAEDPHDCESDGFCVQCRQYSPDHDRSEEEFTADDYEDDDETENRTTEPPNTDAHWAIRFSKWLQTGEQLLPLVGDAELEQVQTLLDRCTEASS